MLSSIKAQLALPSTAYTLDSAAVDAVQKGSSMNSSAYIVSPSQLASAGIAGASTMQLSSSLSRRSPGQRGSNRSQVLAQIVALDVNGRPFVWSCNITLTEANFFVPPANVTVDTTKFSRAVVGTAIGYVLNASGQTGDHQSDWVNNSHDGIVL